MMLSEINQTKKQTNKPKKQIQYNHLDVESRKQNTKTKPDPQIWRTSGWLPERSGVRVEWNRWKGLTVTTFHLYNKCHEDVMYSIGNAVNNVAISLYGDRWLLTYDNQSLHVEHLNYYNIVC